MTYKAITVRVGEHALQEDQVYVVEESVSAEQILKGDDTGVVCLCIVTEMAQSIADSLNNAKAV